MIKRIIKSKYFPVIIIAIVNLIVAYFYIKKPFYGCSDYFTYECAVNYIKDIGASCEITPFYRLLTLPLTLLVAWFVGVFFGGLANGFLVMNLIFYFAVIIVFYNLAYTIFKSRKIALIGTVLFQSNYWLFSYCTVFLSDLGGHFFFLLTSLFALRYYFEKNKKFFYYAIISSVVGVFFKEFGALGMITLGMAILFLDFDWSKKSKEIFYAAILFIFLPGLYHLWFYFQFGFTYFSWYELGPRSYGPEMHSLAMFIKVMGWIYLAGWPIFLFSLWQVKKHFKIEDYKTAVILLPASLAFFAWPIYIQRTAFVLVPWLAIYTGFGLAKVKNKYIIAIILLLYALVGYNIDRLLQIINVPF